jgi:hypothetical protein
MYLYSVSFGYGPIKWQITQIYRNKAPFRKFNHKK